MKLFLLILSTAAALRFHADSEPGNFEDQEIDQKWQDFFGQNVPQEATDPDAVKLEVIQDRCNQDRDFLGFLPKCSRSQETDNVTCVTQENGRAPTDSRFLNVLWAYDNQFKVATNPQTNGPELAPFVPGSTIDWYATFAVFHDIQKNAEKWFGSPAPREWGPITLHVNNVPIMNIEFDFFWNKCWMTGKHDPSIRYYQEMNNWVPVYQSVVYDTEFTPDMKNFVMPIWAIFVGKTFGREKTSFQEVEKILKLGEQPFEDNRIVWRGSVINPNRRHIASLGWWHKDMVDAGDVTTSTFLDSAAKGKYKYQITSIGADFPCPAYEDRSYWALFMNRVVFSPFLSNNLTPVTWHSKDLKLCNNLKEDAEKGCHIVPVREDVSDLLEKYKFLEENPETYARIQKNLNTFAREHLTPAHAYLYVFEHIMGGNSTRRGKDLKMSDFDETLHHQLKRYSSSSWAKPANESKCVWKSDMMVNKSVDVDPPAYIPSPMNRSHCCLDLKNWKHGTMSD